jgi:hypothetical protein
MIETDRLRTLARDVAANNIVRLLKPEGIFVSTRLFSFVGWDSLRESRERSQSALLREVHICLRRGASLRFWRVCNRGLFLLVYRCAIKPKRELRRQQYWFAIEEMHRNHRAAECRCFSSDSVTQLRALEPAEHYNEANQAKHQ